MNFPGQNRVILLWVSCDLGISSNESALMKYQEKVSSFVVRGNSILKARIKFMPL